MTRRPGWMLMTASGLLFAQLALAQSAGGAAQAQAASDANTNTGLVKATETADANAAAGLEVARDAIEKRAAKVSAKAKAKAESQLGVSVRKVDASAEAQGNTVVATRLAAEFGMTTEALLAEKAALGASWGQLMIAHALDANATADVTVAQLVTLHEDGMGWGKIAAGLGLDLGSAVSGVNAEARVAQGLARADGRISAMRGEGARAGVRSGVTAGLGASNGKAGVGAGVGIKIGH